MGDATAALALPPPATGSRMVSSGVEYPGGADLKQSHHPRWESATDASATRTPTRDPPIKSPASRSSCETKAAAGAAAEGVALMVDETVAVMLTVDDAVAEGVREGVAVTDPEGDDDELAFTMATGHASALLAEMM